jgi:hypothetical protein
VVAPEELSALTADRLRADGGQFTGPIWLVKGTVRYTKPAQPFHALEKLSLACDGTDDQVRMRQVSGKKRSCNLDGCVAGLHDLLRKREIVPHEEIDVGRLVLCEIHGWLLALQTLLDCTRRERTGKEP